MYWYFLTFMDSPHLQNAYLFGPYKTWEEANEWSDKVGGTDPIGLPTKNREEAMNILGGVKGG